jgi:AraC family transcriptional regulator
MMRLVERHMHPESTPAGMADEACVSRYHFQRVFSAVMGETPGKLQRRLRLERAAYDLRHTGSEVTTIAFDAGYSCLEAFSRAFRRAYGQSPSRFRQSISPFPGGERGRWRGVNTASDSFGASLVHYDAQTRGLRMFQHEGGRQMDLVDRLLDNDYRAKRGLLESAMTLTDAQLDASLLLRIKLEPWMEPDKSIRQALDRLTDMLWIAEMFTTIGWPHAGSGWLTDGRPANAHTVQEMIDRLDGFFKDYGPFVQHVKDNNLWETTWVDSACEPAETFTFATVIEAGLERGIFRRQVAQRLLEQAGIPVKGW